jgi:hypothetical protein
MPTSRSRRLATLLTLIAIGAATSCASAQAADPCVPPSKLGVAFVLDDSGSMFSSDPTNLRGTATGVGLDQMPDGAVAATSTFDGLAYETFGPTALSGSRDTLKSQVENALGSGGGTDYEIAFQEASRQLAAMPAAVDRKAVVFLSDGEPNDPSYTADQTIAAAHTPIYTIGFGDAPGGELAGIAARSGGQAFVVRSPGEAQAVFARIISLLTCDAAQTTAQVELQPGETRSFPFAVTDTDREFRALAAWSIGDVTVTLTRPDGSTLSPGTQGAGESFIRELTYASVKGVNPAAGSWKMNVTADADNIDTVSVSIDVWKRTSADPPDAAVLVAPADGVSVNAGPTTFSWLPARGATSYDVVVDGSVAGTVPAPATQASVQLGAGAHQWYVAARNQFGDTPSARRSITGNDSPLGMLQRFMPNVFFQHDEPYGLVDVNAMLSSGNVQLCAPSSCSPSLTLTSSDLLTKQPSGWLDFDPDEHSEPSAIYGHADKVSPSGSYRYLDYWWFLKNNTWKNSPIDRHHGDWEGMFVAVPNAGAPQDFAYVGFAAHTSTYLYLRDALRCATPGATDERGLHQQSCAGRQHVNVYSAYGSHASYPRRCSKGITEFRVTCRQSAMEEARKAGVSVQVRLPEGDFDGKKAWSGNGNPNAVKLMPPATASTWVGWAGNWAHPGEGFGGNGVSGPGRQARYKAPWSVLKCTDRWSGDDSDGSDNTIYDCDTATTSKAPSSAACDQWFGPLTVAVVCDPATLTKALATGTLGTPGAFRVETSGAASASAPGLAQAVGGALAPGQKLTVSGTVPASAVLDVSAASGAGTVNARYADLGLEHGGTVVVTASRSGGAVALRATRAGRPLRPRRTAHQSSRRPAAARRLTVRRHGGRLTIRFSGHGARALVAVVRRKGRNTSSVVRLAKGARQRLSVKAGSAPRSVQVTIVAANRMTSTTRTVKIGKG